jgi:hypothetical protein
MDISHSINYDDTSKKALVAGPCGDMHWPDSHQIMTNWNLDLNLDWNVPSLQLNTPANLEGITDTNSSGFTKYDDRATLNPSLGHSEEICGDPFLEDLYITNSPLFVNGLTAIEEVESIIDISTH